MYLQLRYYNELGSGLRIKSLDQVLVVKMCIIEVIPVRFIVKNR